MSGRLRRWVAGLGTGCVLCGGVIGFAADIMDMQSGLCGVGWFQPELGDMCGAYGFGDMPSQAEREAWAGREAGSCEALREHVAAFPEGAYRAEAADLLNARIITEHETWEPQARPLTLFTPALDEYETETDARQASVERAEAEAARLCTGFAAAGDFRLTGTAIAQDALSCDARSTGYSCRYQGEAICALEVRRVVTEEVCGS